MDKSKLKRFFFISLLVIALLTASCSGENIGKSDENSEISAAAVSKIYRACKFSNDDFCEETCCRSTENCNGELAYKECDLETGEWRKEYFSDSNCISKCDIEDSSASTKAEDKIPLNQQSCIEGWKCLSKFEKIYRNSDCSFGETERCKAGCINDTCIKACNPGSFSCRKDALQVCDESGEEWKFYMNCAYGCQNNTCLSETIQNQTIANQTQNNQTQNTTQPVQNACDNACFSITNFHYDAEGNDNNNENDEYITVKNSCSFSCGLTGWQISDDSSHKYSFASFNLGKGNSFTLYTGVGTDTETQLYWNRGSAVWNNDNDTLYLRNANNELILSYSYP